MLSFSTKKLCTVLIAAVALTAGVAHANLVSNGDFETYTGGHSGPSKVANVTSGADAGSTILTGWQVSKASGSSWVANNGQSKSYDFLIGGTGANSSNTNAGSYNVQFPSSPVYFWGPQSSSTGNIANGFKTSPTGGNFFAEDGGFQNNGALTQNVNGLKANTDYKVTFYQAAAQQDKNSGGQYTGATTDSWTVGFGNATSPTQSSATMNLPSQGFSGWTKQTLIFKATSSSAVLSFAAVGTPAGNPPFALLDGVSVTVIPLPSGLSLSLVGMIILAGFNMARNAKKTKQEEMIPAV